jgi:hypothetical protein
MNRKCNAVKNCQNEAVYTCLHDDNEFSEGAFCEEHKGLQNAVNYHLVKFIPPGLKAFL